MTTKYYRMFAGELDGELVLSHIAFRASEVRYSVGCLFRERGYSDIVRGTSWRKARKAGWRVVPLSITKYTGGKRRQPPTRKCLDGLKRKSFHELMESVSPTAAECARNRAWDQVG